MNLGSYYYAKHRRVTPWRLFCADIADYWLPLGGKCRFRHLVEMGS